MSESSNFQQRIFDAFPRHPQFITIFSLRDKFAEYDEEVIRQAVIRLVTLRKVEKVKVNNLLVYRLVRGAKRPIDMRGHHPNVGRKPRAAR